MALSDVMKNMARPFIVILLASLTAYGSYLLLFRWGWLNLIPWALITLLLGYISDSRKEAIIHGILFGYFLFFVYLIVGYDGKTGIVSMLRFLGFAAGFSVLGAIAGWIGTLIGRFLRKRISL